MVFGLFKTKLWYTERNQTTTRLSVPGVKRKKNSKTEYQK